MRYNDKFPRLDDPAGVMEHTGRYSGGVALVILGGYSAKRWQELYASIRPDVIIGANGVNSMVHGLDYWVIAENMTRTARLANEGEADAIRYMEMFNRDAGAKCKMVSHHSWRRLLDTRNCIKIRRHEYLIDGSDFNFREYGYGFLQGWVLQHTEAGVPVNVGTVGTQLLHLAGILGVAEVHTIGFDLMFREDNHHHAYDYPLYEADRFRNPEAFVEYKGYKSQWVWIETAQYLKQIEPLFERDGLTWRDHSEGLLKIEGLNCAK